MAEIDSKKEVQEEKQEEQQEEYKEPSAIEQKAIADGWRPLDDWTGDPDDWKDAKSFVRDGELFKKIEEVKRENKNLRKTVSTFKDHYDKVRDNEYQRALETLKQQKKEALREGDTDLAVDLDDKIDAKKIELYESRQMEGMAKNEPEIHPEFAVWVSHNKWYDTNLEVREFADQTGVAYKKTHMQASPKEVLNYVEERVTKGYPELFKNAKKNSPSTVEGGSGPRKPNSKITLTDFETSVMKKLVRSGALTEAQYMKDIEDLDKQGKR